MRKLYMIRLENGNSVILQADTEEQALRDAGLRIDPADRAALTGESDLCETHLQLVRQGFGPQNYTIRELQDFMCVAELSENGEFEFGLDSDQAYDEFRRDYPCLVAAEEEIAKAECDEISPENKDSWQLLEEAVLKERTRLLIAR